MFDFEVLESGVVDEDTYSVAADDVLVVALEVVVSFGEEDADVVSEAFTVGV